MATSYSVDVHLPKETEVRVIDLELARGTAVLSIEGVSFYGTPWQIEELLHDALNQVLAL